MNNSFKLFTAAIVGMALFACSNNADQTDGTSTLEETEMSTSTASTVVPGSYTELNTGRTVYIIPDPETGYAVDSITKVPVELYIDNSGDTIFQTGMVVNHALVQSDGKWMLDETKIKRDGDEIKIKYDDDSKIKMDDDELKIKGDEGKIKVDDDTTKVKPND